MLDSIRDRVRPLSSIDPLIDRLSRARVVMMGEATHGTQEFYEWRRVLSQRLIEEHGFQFIAVEGDWPDCQSVHQAVSSRSAMPIDQALSAFTRWPTWMWANTEIARLGNWLKDWNEKNSPDRRVGFHGLDVYSLFQSIDAAIGAIGRADPFLARRMQRLYECFTPFQHDERSYARFLLQSPEGCADEVALALEELFHQRIDQLSKNDPITFDIQQNARVIKNAEAYYRAMVQADDHSWNIRDRHMMETLDFLLRHYGKNSKGIVWAHNTHIGDHRATDMDRQGLVNIGGLARMHLGEDAVALLGFGTHSGQVIASHSWEGPIQKLNVPPASDSSIEHVMHLVGESSGLDRYYFIPERASRQGPLGSETMHRAIGVVYDPDHEYSANYVPTRLAYRYDAFVFIDRTRALEPIRNPFLSSELPETWPVGM